MPAVAVIAVKVTKASKVYKPPVVAKAAPSHPTYSAMVEKAVSELKEKGGSSRIAIVKFLLDNFQLGENVTKINAHLRTALKSGVTKGDLKQVSGTGATGSFKLGEKKTVSPKKVAKKTTPEKKAKSTMKKTAGKSKSHKKGKAASPKKPIVKATNLRRLPPLEDRPIKHCS